MVEETKGVTPASTDPVIDIAEEAASAPADATEESSSSEDGTPKSAHEAIEAALQEESGEPDVQPDPPKEEEPAPESSPEPPVTPEAEKETPTEPNLEELYQTPEGLADKSKERFENLVRDNKSVRETLEAKETEVTEMSGYVQQIQGAIQDANSTPEDFGRMLGYMKLANSRNVEDNRQALALLQTEIRKLAEITGDVPDGDDPLSNHPDLQQAIEDMSMTEEHAVELAKLRNQNKASARREQTIVTETETANQQQQELDQATTDVKALIANWKKTDIDFDVKQAILLEMAPEIKETYSPSQWTAALKQAWVAIGKGVSLKGKQAPPESIVPSIATTTPASAGNIEPQSAHEAVQRALGDS